MRAGEIVSKTQNGRAVTEQKEGRLCSVHFSSYQDCHSISTTKQKCKLKGTNQSRACLLAGVLPFSLQNVLEKIQILSSKCPFPAKRDGFCISFASLALKSVYNTYK